MATLPPPPPPSKTGDAKIDTYLQTLYKWAYLMWFYQTSSGTDAIGAEIGGRVALMFGLDGENGEDGLTIPGPQGMRGYPGLTIPGMDGMDGEDGLTIVGQQGPQGIAGIGIPGMDGQDGEDASAGVSTGMFDPYGAAAAAQAASQPVDTQLSSIAALADASGWLNNNGSGVFAYSTPSASDVGAQPADADLTTWAGITPGTGVGTALAVNVGTDGAFVVKGGALGSPSTAGTLPAFTLGGAVSGGGNQINNVVIGASTPLAGSFTTISGTGGGIADSSSNSVTWSLNNTYAGGKNWTFYSSGGGPAPAGVFGLYNSTDGYTAFKYTHAVGLAVTDAISATTGIAVGGATPGTGGIAFPATAVPQADPNTLDDYEEGTWTATATPQTSGTITLSADAGTYTKNGREVTINVPLTVGSVSSPVGVSVVIGGLPFTAATNTAVDIRPEGLAGGAPASIVGFAGGSGTYLYIQGYTTPSYSTLANYMQAGSVLVLTCTYHI